MISRKQIEQTFPARILWVLPCVLAIGLMLTGCEKTSTKQTGNTTGSTTGRARGNGDNPISVVDAGPKSYPKAKFASPSDGINREGLPQKWITAADEKLPEDFAEGDALIDAWSAEPQTLTPYVSRDAYASDIQAMVLERLIYRDLDTLQFVPGLAKSWEMSEDGMSITFKLFKHARFSDGKPVTADDVIFSYDTVVNPKIDAPQLRSYIADNFKKWEKVDDHTVRFELKKKYFKALEVCGMFVAIIPMHKYGDYAPKVFNEDIRDVLVGSGPWKLSSWDKNNQVVLERNEDYWGPKTPLKKLTVRFIKNELPRFQDYKAGNIDMIAPTSEQWANNSESPEIKARGQALKYYAPGNGYGYLGYNLRLAKFADKRVRKALTMLVDRDELIDTLLYGLGEIVTGPFYFQGPQYNNDIDPIEYDLDGARKLLAEAGWSDTDGDKVLDKDIDGDGVRDPFKIVFLMPSGSSYGDRLQRYIQAQFAKAGIQVSLDKLEWPVFEQRLTERKFEMVSLRWTGTSEGDPYQIWHSSQAENRGSNYIGYKNEDLDRVIEQARMEMDIQKRMKLWHEVHKILHEDQPYTFMFAPPSRRFIDKRFKNTRIHKLGLWETEWYVPKQLQK